MNVLISFYDIAESWWVSLKTAKIISNLVLLFFIGGLVITLLTEIQVLDWKIGLFFSVELAFSVLLIAEILSLVFIFTNSVANSIGKQFEIVSLIFLRDSFKELGHLPINIVWGTELLIELLPIMVDALGAVLIFLIVGLFYKNQKHTPITQNQKDQEYFVKIKKIIAIGLILIFMGLGIRDIWYFFLNYQFYNSFKTYYMVLIFTDIFILIFSYRFAGQYIHLFRYSSFTLATVVLRLSLSAPQYFNVLLGLTAGLFILTVTYVYNFLNTTPIPNEAS